MRIPAAPLPHWANAAGSRMYRIAVRLTRDGLSLAPVRFSRCVRHFFDRGSVVPSYRARPHAREEPSAIERWIARRARIAAVPRDAANKTNPVPNTPEILAEARAPTGRIIAPPARQRRQRRVAHGQADLSSGPGYAPCRNAANDRWRVILRNPKRSSYDRDAGVGRLRSRRAGFLEAGAFYSPSAGPTFEEKKEMEKLNPKGPDDRKEEEEERNF